MERVRIVVEFAPSIVTTRHAVIHKKKIIEAIEAILEEFNIFQKSEYSVYFTWR